MPVTQTLPTLPFTTGSTQEISRSGGALFEVCVGSTYGYTASVRITPGVSIMRAASLLNWVKLLNPSQVTVRRRRSLLSLETLEDTFHAALHSTLENGLPQETFDRVASRLAGQFDSVLERDRAGFNRDLALGQLMSATPVFTLEDQITAVEDVRLEGVNEFLKSLLVDGREVTRLVSVER